MASPRQQHERDVVEEATARAEKRNEGGRHTTPKGSRERKEGREREREREREKRAPPGSAIALEAFKKKGKKEGEKKSDDDEEKTTTNEKTQPRPRLFKITNTKTRLPPPPPPRRAHDGPTRGARLGQDRTHPEGGSGPEGDGRRRASAAAREQ
jgi:hypothetical protein